MGLPCVSEAMPAMSNYHLAYFEGTNNRSTLAGGTACYNSLYALHKEGLDPSG